MKLPTRLTSADMTALPLPAGRLSKPAFDTGDIELRFYAPKGVDAQVPHERDELYFVVSGTGTYERAAERVSFAPGDVLYAAVGEQHRFVDFTDDLAVWVLFYGPVRK